ncbi:hypothetical protein [Rhodopirellula sp. SWK7]|uniref:hypothetical protein n=1 Tax=Rhodopirellula sp. SWK7 TaxID=595460 RepID=UPI001181B974|nr:hypothetical protein [Rhodopirellula sp. SWK7]
MTNAYEIPPEVEPPRPPEPPTIFQCVLRAIVVVPIMSVSPYVIWIGYLILFGALDGDASVIFHDRFLWQTEIDDKMPVLVLLGIVAAVITMLLIFGHRSDCRDALDRYDAKHPASAEDRV